MVQRMSERLPQPLTPPRKTRASRKGAAARASAKNTSEKPEAAAAPPEPQRRHGRSSTRLEAASNGADEVTDWDRISSSSRAELEHLVEVLKSVKRGDFAVRFEYQQRGMLSRVGELLNDIFGLTEQVA